MADPKLQLRRIPGATRRFGGRRAGFVLVAVLMALGSCATSASTLPDASDTISNGSMLFRSEGCFRCHGEQGEGLVGPRLRDGGVLETFPSCAAQLMWVSLGSAGWSREVGPTYGATAKPVQGGMPGFGARLEDRQLMEVVTFTRSALAGAGAEDVVADCFG